MARKRKSAEEKEAAKLARRAEKKAERAALKATAKAAVVVPTKGKRKSKTDPYKIIEVPEADKNSMIKLAALREAGADIRQYGYASGFYLYVVPSTLNGYAEHGTTEVLDADSGEPQPSLKTIEDLVKVVTEKLANKEKVNKRQVKLLVRGSDLKRNIKKEAVSTLIKKFKIK
jgi:hypothetical protein